jgi:hypothetical protein
MHSRKGATAAAILAGAAGLFATVDAAAQTAEQGRFEYIAGIDVEHDTNITLSQDNPVSQDVLMPSFAFTYVEQGAVLEAHAGGTVQYRDYLSGAFADEFSGNVSGVFNWHIAPERFDWTLEDYIGRQPVDVLANDTPDNQQQTNVFVTGPTLRAHFSDAIRGQLDLRYTNSYAEQTQDFNGDRFGVTGRLIDLLTPSDTISANVGWQDVRYDHESTATDYDRADTYGTYVRTSGYGQLQLDAGYSWLNFKGNNVDNHSGVLLRAIGRYEFNQSTLMTFTVSDRLSDAVDLLAVDPTQIGQIVIGSGLTNALISPSVYEEDRIDFALEHNAETYSFRFAPFWYRDDYIEDIVSATTGLNSRVGGFYGSYDYRLRPQMTLTAFGGVEYRRYTDFDRQDHIYDFGVRWGWQFTQHWATRLSLHREIQATNAPDLSYHGNVIAVGVTYSR